MKNNILICLLILSAVQYVTAQKINLNYKVKCVDSLYVFTNYAFSEKNIQTKSDKIFSSKIQNNSIISIEDNTNKRFEKINFNNISYYPKLLIEGYFKLYELELHNKIIYFICSKNDTVVLESNDSIVDQKIIKDTRYNGQLIFLCKDYPYLQEKAKKANFRKQDFETLISLLNNEYRNTINIKRQERNRIDYLSVSLKGYVFNNENDLMLDVLRSHYFLNISPNISFRYGLMANYYQQTRFVPEIVHAWYYSGSDGIRRDINIYKYHFEATTAGVFEIPLLINFEITNSWITPYLFGGIAPSINFRKIKRSDSDLIYNSRKFILNRFVIGGIKFKLTNGLNILTEYRFEKIKGQNLEFGIEYFF